MATFPVRLEQIWIKRVRRGVMEAMESAELVTGCGITGNRNQGGKRQVTLIEREVWEAMMKQLGASLPVSTRRANLVVSGLREGGAPGLTRTTGRVLAIHSAAGTCRLRILGETIPCSRMDEALPGLADEMIPDWRGGAFAEVLTGGAIAAGATLEWVADDSVIAGPGPGDQSSKQARLPL
jgi:MOSC domain-containing protein YiiM